MTYERLIQQPQHLLLKCISGSRAYNLALPDSDTDIKGIFVLPQEQLYGLKHTAQVSNETSDEVFFEIGRFIELLIKNNPNILELLSSPANCILYRHPLVNLIQPEDFLSRLCRGTFAGYAETQIRKARGLNKKINRKFERDRKSVLDFCHVIRDNSTVPLSEWLTANGLHQEHCGLAALSHFRDAYLLYHQPFNTATKTAFRGIISNPSANDVVLSDIPKGTPYLAIMHFNKDAYSVYCREYREYWQWVEMRNEERYLSTIAHGQNYDAKHLMHTFRLLSMAEEIALHKKVIVHRNDREFLLRIRAGEFTFEDLISRVEVKMAHIDELYADCDLPDTPNVARAEDLLVEIRKVFYAEAHS